MYINIHIILYIYSIGPYDRSHSYQTFPYTCINDDDGDNDGDDDDDDVIMVMMIVKVMMIMM
jgi:hypothetical protein